MYRLNKTSWADDVDELGQFDQPRIEDSVDENGIRISVEYLVNDAGRKVKVSKEVEKFSIYTHLRMSRLLVASGGHCKSPSWTMQSRKGRNWPNLEQKKGNKQALTGLRQQLLRT